MRRADSEHEADEERFSDAEEDLVRRVRISRVLSFLLSCKLPGYASSRVKKEMKLSWRITKT